MSSGSSNLDPSEFNENAANDQGLENVTSADEENAEENQRAQLASARRSSTNQRRRRRRRLSRPPNHIMLRIWVYSHDNIIPMNRQFMNRIMFSVGRCLRIQSSRPAQPGRRMPAIHFRRNGNISMLDVERI